MKITFFNHKWAVVFLLLLVIAGSCKKDFLDVPDTTFLNRQTNITDLNTLGQYMKGIYPSVILGIGTPVMIGYADVMGDNIKPNTASAALYPFYTWSQVAERDPTGKLGMNLFWRNAYFAIRSCSYVIEIANKFRAENEAKADHIKGQALAIRALVHFELVNIFAQAYPFSEDGSHPGVPYITTSDIAAPYTRNTVRDVYTKMIEDLTNASGLLSPDSTDTRFMNLVTSKALLARVYLFKGDYQNAGSLAKAVADQYPLMQITNGYPDNLFKNRPLYQTETFFQLTPFAYTSPFIYTSFTNYSNLASDKASDDIAVLLTGIPGDIRGKWVLKSGADWKIAKFPAGVTGTTGPVFSPGGDYYWCIIRSSEMYLTVAEAAAKTGDESTARNYLDSVRQRANPATPAITASGVALLDSVYTERRKEFAFEGFRMFDLKRWKQGVHRIDVLVNAPKDLPYPSNKAVAPIPLRDVTLAGLAQNPGY